MGEVRVKIKLTNAADVALAENGYIPQREIRTVETEGIVDTGAVISTMPDSIFTELGLRAWGEIDAWLADDNSVRVRQTQAVNIEIEGRQTSESMLVLGSAVLIGQTLLERLDFLVDCPGQRITPNPAHGNQMVLMIR